MECKKCGSTNTEIRPRGVNNAHVCTDCGAFIRWAKKDELPEEDTPCDYCYEDYVIPKVFDGGITAWENIDAAYCPICGRGR